LLEKFLLHFSPIFAKQNSIESAQLNIRQAMMRQHVAFLGRKLREIDRASTVRLMRREGRRETVSIIDDCHVQSK
jgi:hypothetical protein